MWLSLNRRYITGCISYMSLILLSTRLLNMFGQIVTGWEINKNKSERQTLCCRVTLAWRCQVHASLYDSNKLTNQMQQFYKFITWYYVSLNMFRTPPHPSSGAYNCINSLRFYHHAPTVKPEAVNAVLSSWWWAWKRPKHVERNKKTYKTLTSGWLVYLNWLRLGLEGSIFTRQKHIQNSWGLGLPFPLPGPGNFHRPPPSF
jgi:hypothetical protein